MTVAVKIRRVRFDSGKLQRFFDIWLDDVWLGTYPQKRSAVGALTVRKVPIEKAKQFVESALYADDMQRRLVGKAAR